MTTSSSAVRSSSQPGRVQPHRFEEDGANGVNRAVARLVIGPCLRMTASERPCATARSDATCARVQASTLAVVS